MTSSISTSPQQSVEEPQKKAGDIELCLTGRKTYLAPLPLPTEAEPCCPYISDYNDIYLDFGGGEPNVFSYQVNLGGPFSCACLVAIGFPLLGGFIALTLGYGTDESWEAVRGIFLVAWGIAIKMWLATSAVCFAIWLHHHKLFTQVIPTRFNRQRREVCFMPDGATQPLFVPWESLSAWVVQGQSATQYGITRHYGMGMGFMHEGELVSVEFQCGALQLAIANWEAVRGYMEYELNDLHAIQDPLELQAPGDPSHEGLHTFRNARASLHRRIWEKEVWWVYGFFWYVYHVMTLWTLPNHLVEWEIKRIAKVGRKALPEAMREWSEPLPPEQWAKPSAELLRLSANVKALVKRSPRKPITEVFAEAYRSEPTSRQRG